MKSYLHTHFLLAHVSTIIFCSNFIDYEYRPLSEALKPLKAFILEVEPLEPLKCIFGPLSDLIFSFEIFFAAFCPKNWYFPIFGGHFCKV